MKNKSTAFTKAWHTLALIVLLGTQITGQTTINVTVPFNVNPPGHGQNYEEAGVTLRVCEGPNDDACGYELGGECLFFFGNFYVDFSNINGILTGIEIDVIDACNIGGFNVQFSEGGNEVGFVSNTKVGENETLVYIPPSNRAIDNFRMSTCEGNVCEIRLIYLSNEPPPVFSISLDASAVSCHGSSDGSATVIPINGVAPYTYLWSNGANTPTISNLPAGNYSVTVFDGTGTGNSLQGEVTVTEPNQINVSVDELRGATCRERGQINISIPNRTSYTLRWSNGATSEEITNLNAGIYRLTVTDGSGCTYIESIEVPDLAQPPIVDAGPDKMITCENPTTTLDGSNTIIYETTSFMWSGNPGANIIAGENSLTPQVRGVSTYFLIVTDNLNGCTGIDEVEVIDNRILPNVSAGPDVFLPCLGEVDLVPIVNDDRLYTYEWEAPNGEIIFSNQDGFVELITEPGTYSLTVEDAINGCSITDEVEVLSPNKPEAELLVQAPDCGLNNGQINVQVQTGNPPFTYLWNTGARENFISGIGAGNYYVVVSDGNNCQDTAFVSLLDQDQFGPTIVVNSSLTFGLPSNGSINLNPQDFIIELSDDCTDIDDITVTVNPSTLSCEHVGEQQITFIAVDQSGNQSFVTSNVLVVDNTGPFLVNPSLIRDTTVSCENNYIPSLSNQDVNDNCSDFVNILLSFDTLGSDCGYTVRYNWILEDENNNQSVFTNLVTYVDNVNPIINYEETVTLNCNENSNSIPLPEVLDNCSAVSILYEESPLQVETCPIGVSSLTRTYTAIDACGNQTIAQQKVLFVDNEPPLFIDTTRVITALCGGEVNVPFPRVVDNCSSDVQITFEENVVQTGNCAIGVETRTRVYTAIDACGNQSTFQQTIHLVDEEPPVFIEATEVITALCGSELNVPFPRAVDNCSSDVQITFEENVVQTGNCEIGAETRTRVYIATDVCGNQATFQQTIHFVDEEPPVFIEPTEVITALCGNELNVPFPRAVDNCSSDVQITFEENVVQTGNCAIGAETRTRVYIATDVCGNQATFQQTIHFVDEEPPVFIEATEVITALCGSELNVPLPRAVDNCSSDVQITFEENVVQTGNCEIGAETRARVYTAIDACGNQSTFQQTIHFVDEEPPVFIEATEVITALCGSELNVPLPRAVDNCSSDVQITFEENVVQTGNCEIGAETRTRVYTAIDACGNQSTFQQTIHFVDDEPPVFIEATEVITALCGSELNVPLPRAVDNCSSDVQITFEENVVQTGNCEIGAETRTRVYIATDVCGNQSTFQQTIHLVDDTRPVFEEIPSEITVSCEEEINLPNAVDACSESVTVSYEDRNVFSGNCDGELIIERFFIAIDNCGNRTEVEQTVTVIDTSPPVFINLAGEITINCDSLDFIQEPTLEDNCSSQIELFFEDEMENSCSNQMIKLTRTWWAMDACGNRSGAVQIINLMDISPPNFIVSLEDLTVTCEEIPNPIRPEVTDGCHNSIVNFLGETKTLNENGYTLNRSWVASDLCKNLDTLTRLIHVIDTVAPIIVCEIDTLTVTTCTTPVAVTYPQPSVQSDCEDEEISFTFTGIPSGELFTEPYNTIQYKAVDAFGNTSTCTMIIELKESGMLPVDFSIAKFPCAENESNGEIMAVGNGGIPPYKFQWDNGMNGESIEGLTQGLYTVTVTDSLGCQGVGEITLDLAEPISISVDRRTISSENGQIFITPDGGNAPYTFEWYLDDSLLVATEEDPPNLSVGNYFVYVTDANNCTNKFEVVLDESVNTFSIENKIGLSVFPNPFTEHTILYLELPKKVNVRVQLFDYTGRKIKSVQSTSLLAKGDHTFEINSENLNFGIYHLIVQIDETIHARKIVLTK